MSIKVKDSNRAELVKAILKQNGGRIFSVTAKRKSPKSYFIVGKICSSESDIGVETGDKFYLNTKKNQALLEQLRTLGLCEITEHTEHFMTLTCRTGVKKDLKGGSSTIKDKPELISVYLTDGGYRCFSAFNVLEIKAGGTTIKFNEKDVLSFQGE